MEPKKPVDHVRDGNVRASIWRNQGEHGPFYSTTLARRYQDKEGNWHENNRFSDDDLLRVPGVAQQAREKSRAFREADRENARSQFEEKRQDKAPKRNNDRSR